MAENKHFSIANWDIYHKLNKTQEKTTKLFYKLSKEGKLGFLAKKEESKTKKTKK